MVRELHKAIRILDKEFSITYPIAQSHLSVHHPPNSHPPHPHPLHAQHPSPPPPQHGHPPPPPTPTAPSPHPPHPPKPPLNIRIQIIRLNPHPLPSKSPTPAYATVTPRCIPAEEFSNTARQGSSRLKLLLILRHQRNRGSESVSRSRFLNSHKKER